MIDTSAAPVPITECTISICPLSVAQVDYIPTLAGNAIFLAAFGVLLLLHTFLGIRYRTWGVLVGMFGGLLLEVLGYVGRIQMHYNPFRYDAFKLQFIGLTIAPAFLSASVYLCLARIVIVHGEQYSRLRPRTYSLLFVSFDFLALVLQSVGGAITALSETKEVADKGINVMLSGLAFQLFSLLLFMGMWGEFSLRVRRASAEALKTNAISGNPSFAGLRLNFRFKLFEIALWSAAICIFIRSVYRLAELHAGFSSEIANNEPAFMALEAPMIILATAALAAFHPGYAFDGQWAQASWSFRGAKEIIDQA